MTEAKRDPNYLRERIALLEAFWESAADADREHMRVEIEQLTLVQDHIDELERVQTPQFPYGITKDGQPLCDGVPITVARLIDHIEQGHNRVNEQAREIEALERFRDLRLRHNEEMERVVAENATLREDKALETINTNDCVWVKLTDEGLGILRADAAALRERVPRLRAWQPPSTDADGWSKFQLWCLMQDFGPHISLGRRVPFGTEIRLTDPAIDAAKGDG